MSLSDESFTFHFSIGSVYLKHEIILYLLVSEDAVWELWEVLIVEALVFLNYFNLSTVYSIELYDLPYFLVVLIDLHDSFLVDDFFDSTSADAENSFEYVDKEPEHFDEYVVIDFLVCLAFLGNQVHENLEIMLVKVEFEMSLQFSQQKIEAESEFNEERTLFLLLE